jgi:hypothetical protein
MRKLLLFLCLLAALALIVPALGALNPIGNPTQAAWQGSLTTHQTQQHPGSYRVLGHPTITAAHINAVLAAYHSPTSGLGQALYEDGVRYGIDPVYALAFFLHESRFGTTGEARKTMSLGNERCITDRPCIDRQLGGYAQMEGWQDGFLHWYRLIFYGYVQGQVTMPLVGHICTTIEQIIPVYSPSSDSNDVAGYVQAVTNAVDAWRAGEVMV